MRIALHDYAGHGFIIQLSRELSLRGHEIYHLYGEHNPTPKGILTFLPGDSKNLSLIPISLSESFKKYSLLQRWRQEREYGRRLVSALDKIDPQIVLSAQTPLDPQGAITRFCSRQEIPQVVWVQDLIGLAIRKILSHRLSFFGSLVGRYYEKLEQNLLHQANGIITITDDFLPILRSWGIEDTKISVIPNWAPLEQLPVMGRKNPWSNEKGIAQTFTFLYTGTLGFKHNPGLLIELASHFENRPEVSVVVVSEGPGASWIKEEMGRQRIQNIILLPFQSMEKYPQVLASGDVLVGILESDAGIFSVPSKILSYLCAERPILLSVPTENLASSIVHTSQAGIATNPEVLSEFLSAADLLFGDSELRTRFGKNGRNYAEEHFDITNIAIQFESILKNILY